MPRKCLQQAVENAGPLLIAQLPRPPSGFSRAVDVMRLSAYRGWRCIFAAIGCQRLAATLQIEQFQLNFRFIFVFRPSNPARAVEDLDHRREPGSHALPLEEPTFRVEKTQSLDPPRLPFAAHQEGQQKSGAAVIEGEDQVGLGNAQQCAQHLQCWVSMVDDDQFQPGVHEWIYLSAFAVGNHGHFSIWVEARQLKQKRSFQDIIAKGAKAEQGNAPGGHVRAANYIVEEMRYVFLDRDGVLNRKMPEGAWVTEWSQFEWLPGAIEAIGRMNRAGLTLILVTNQRGIALGLYTEEQLGQLHRSMRADLARHGARVDAIYYCPHNEGACDCRKPGIGLFVQARRDFPEIDGENSVVIGDSLSDIQAGRQLGMKTIFIEGEKDRQKSSAGAAANAADLVAASLLHAIEQHLAL